MLYLHHANRMEDLAARLAGRLAVPVGGGWAPETLVVASNGMRRWLCLDLADRLGICANLHFPLPSRLFWDIYRAVLPGVPTESAFATPILAWRVLAEFERLDDDPVWAPLRAYLAGSDDYGRYELALRIADSAAAGYTAAVRAAGDGMVEVSLGERRRAVYLGERRGGSAARWVALAVIVPTV